VWVLAWVKGMVAMLANKWALGLESVLGLAMAQGLASKWELEWV